MSAPIFNREFQHPADGWYQIEAKGEHPHHAAEVTQVIDDAAVKAIVDDFNNRAAAGTLRHGNEMLVDHEHFSAQPDQETRAYGWLQQLQARPDGVYGKIHWTATGKMAVDGGDYRFFSTEYDREDCKVLNSGKPERVRPLRLDGLTLTNMNNNKGQKAITNRNAARQQQAEEETDSREAQYRAAWLFEQLVQLDLQRTGGPRSLSMQMVVNRERPLYALASGKQPANAVFAFDPSVRSRLKIINREILHTMNGGASKAANAAAPKVLEYLESNVAHPDDSIGERLAKRGATEGETWRTFVAQLRKLTKEQGLSIADAFAKLKKDEPLFWTQAMLSFSPPEDAT